MLLTEQLYGSITPQVQDHALTRATTHESLVAIFNLIVSCNTALIVFILEVSQDVVVLIFRHYGKNASLSAS
jgi:hypothetical protein